MKAEKHLAALTFYLSEIFEIYKTEFRKLSANKQYEKTLRIILKRQNAQKHKSSQNFPKVIKYLPP